MDPRAERILSPAMVVAALLLILILAFDSPPGPDLAGPKTLPRQAAPTRSPWVAPHAVSQEPAPDVEAEGGGSSAQGPALAAGHRVLAAAPRTARVSPTSASEPASPPADPAVVAVPPTAAPDECPSKPRGKSNPNGNAQGHAKDTRCRE